MSEKSDIQNAPRGLIFNCYFLCFLIRPVISECTGSLSLNYPDIGRHMGGAVTLICTMKLDNCSRWRIEAQPTTLILNFDFGLQPQESYGHDMTHAHTKGQGQRSLGSTVLLLLAWKQTIGQTDRGDCITSRANRVGNNCASRFCV